MASVSSSPFQGSMVTERMTRSASSTTRSFNVLDPAFTTSVFTPSVGPGPLGHLGQIITVLAGPGPGAGAGIHHFLMQAGRTRTEARNARDDIHHQVVPVHVVHHHH